MPAPAACTARRRSNVSNPPADPSPGPDGDLREAAQVPQVVLVEAEPLPPLAQPVYPPRALEARVPWSVSVSLTIDGHGRVTDVRQSLVGFSTPGPFAAEFFAAVEVAVRQWQFAPAQIWYLEQVGENEKMRPTVTRTQNVETTLDLAFTFTPSGAVLPARSNKGG